MNFIVHEAITDFVFMVWAASRFPLENVWRFGVLNWNFVVSLFFSKIKLTWLKGRVARSSDWFFVSNSAFRSPSIRLLWTSVVSREGSLSWLLLLLFLCLLFCLFFIAQKYSFVLGLHVLRLLLISEALTNEFVSFFSSDVFSIALSCNGKYGEPVASRSRMRKEFTATSVGRFHMVTHIGRQVWLVGISLFSGRESTGTESSASDWVRSFAAFRRKSENNNEVETNR